MVLNFRIAHLSWDGRKGRWNGERRAFRTLRNPSKWAFQEFFVRFPSLLTSYRPAAPLHPIYNQAKHRLAHTPPAPNHLIYSPKHLLSIVKANIKNALCVLSVLALLTFSQLHNYTITQLQFTLRGG